MKDDPDGSRWSLASTYTAYEFLLSVFSALTTRYVNTVVILSLCDSRASLCSLLECRFQFMREACVPGGRRVLRCRTAKACKFEMTFKNPHRSNWCRPDPSSAASRGERQDQRLLVPISRVSSSAKAPSAAAIPAWAWLEALELAMAPLPSRARSRSLPSTSIAKTRSGRRMARPAGFGNRREDGLLREVVWQARREVSAEGLVKLRMSFSNEVIRLGHLQWQTALVSYGISA